MDELPESLKDEIDALDSLDARALRRRYAPLVADLPNCALCGVLRATVAYRLLRDGDLPPSSCYMAQSYEAARMPVISSNETVPSSTMVIHDFLFMW